MEQNLDFFFHSAVFLEVPKNFIEFIVVTLVNKVL